jgi:hypothetical protein
LGRGFSLLIWGKIIYKIADLGSKKAGLSFKENFNWEEAFSRSLLYK